MNINPDGSVVVSDGRSLTPYLKQFAARLIQFIGQRGSQIQKRKQNRFDTGLFPDCLGFVIDEDSIYPWARYFLRYCNFSSDICFCMEMQLQAAETDNAVLEIWSMDMKYQPDPSITLPSALTSMTALLLSVFSVSQSTTAIKFLEQEYGYPFPIFYRLHVGPPQLHLLGPVYEQNDGEIATPVGLITVTHFSREKMSDVWAREETLISENDLNPDASSKTMQPIDQFSSKSSSSVDESSTGGACASSSAYLDVPTGEVVFLNEPWDASSSDMKHVQLPAHSIMSFKSANKKNDNLRSSGDLDFDCNTNMQARKKIRSESFEYDDFVKLEMVKRNTSELNKIPQDFAKFSVETQLPETILSGKQCLNPVPSKMKKIDVQKQLPNTIIDCGRNANMTDVNLGSGTAMDCSEQNAKNACHRNTGFMDFDMKSPVPTNIDTVHGAFSEEFPHFSSFVSFLGESIITQSHAAC